jgi:hypothetical protein
MYIILCGIIGVGVVGLCIIGINLMNELEEIVNDDWGFFDEIDVDLDIVGDDDDGGV